MRSNPPRRELEPNDEGPAVRPTAVSKGVLIVSSHFPPGRSAGVHRILRIVKQLRAAAWPVAVLTIDPRYYRDDASIDADLLDRIPAGSEVCRTRVLRGLTTAARWRRQLRQVFRRRIHRRSDKPIPDAPLAAASRARPKRPLVDTEIGWLLPAIRGGSAVVARQRPEIIFSSAPPFTCHLIAGWLAWRHHLRWVADFRDPWARSPWKRAELKDGWKGRFRQWLERRVIERADVVILNTPFLRDEFVAYYGARLAQKFHTVTNGYDADVLTPYLHAARRRSSRLMLTHAGSLYRQRDPRPLVRAVASAIAKGRIAADSIDLNFVGAVSPQFQLAETIAELNVGSAVRMTPPVTHERSLQYLAESDVLVAIQPGTGVQVPVKLYEYLPFQKPILALAPSGALSTIIEDGGLGLVVSPDDPDAIENALCDLWAHRDRLAERFHADAAYIAQFDGAVVSRKLQGIFETLSVGRQEAWTPSQDEMVEER